jgi:preprotein translocase subunit SecG
MTIKNILLAINIISAILIVVLILMQGRGAGLGNAWGGGGEMFQTRRGVEKLTLRLTTILIIIFFIISVANLFLK